MPCCPNALPLTVHVTLTGSGDCAPFSGVYPITWTGASWFGTFTVSGHPVSVTVNCMGSDCTGFVLNVTCDAANLFTGLATTCSCSPFSATFTPSGGPGACCTANFTATVTA